MIIQKAQLARAEAGIAGVETDDLAFPLGLQNIPGGFELGGFDQLRVVGDGEAGNAAFVDEDVFALRIDEQLLAFPPERGVEHFRQDESGSDWVEEFALIKTVQRSGTAE